MPQQHSNNTAATVQIVEDYYNSNSNKQRKTAAEKTYFFAFVPLGEFSFNMPRMRRFGPSPSAEVDGDASLLSVEIRSIVVKQMTIVEIWLI